VVAY
jgi:hypothetical protein